jgi:cytochrome c peroxidase
LRVLVFHGIAALGVAAAIVAVLTGCGGSRAERERVSIAASTTVPLAAVAAAASAAKAYSPVSFYETEFERRPSPAELTALGRVLFADTALSASGRLSCASCHDPAHAYGPPDGRAVRLGGVDGKTPGVRAVPSLRYQQDAPPFTEHYMETDGNDSADQGPAGGRGWDGRASSAHEQAALPLLSSFEMANGTIDAAVDRLRASPNAALFRGTFGPHALDTPSLAWNGLLWALEVFQQSPEDFYPYSSKYDAFLRGKAELDAREQRGLALFEDPAKGNCAVCHMSAIRHGAFPQFTDHGFVALGVPRNAVVPANRDPAYRDLGLCGPLRTDFTDRREYCGLFKTPTLRNVAARKVFFHNGVFHSLDDVLAFYAERDTRPSKFYPRDRSGRVLKYDDLPAAFAGNVNVEPPFGGASGTQPALTVGERGDIVAFLRTLTDGWQPQASASGGRRMSVLVRN